MNTLDCIKCGKTIATIENNLFTFKDGISLFSTGNYGSTVLDLFSARQGIILGLCDQCLQQAQKDNRVFISEEQPAPEPTIVPLTDWDQLR